MSQKRYLTLLAAKIFLQQNVHLKNCEVSINGVTYSDNPTIFPHSTANLQTNRTKIYYRNCQPAETKRLPLWKQRSHTDIAERIKKRTHHTRI